MIFTEDQINNNYGVDAFDILSEASYVDGLDIISPTTIPMAENSSVGGIVVRFSDVESLAEETGLDYIDTMLLIAENHNLDPAYMAVAVNESEVIVNPEIIEELANVVIIPQSENSLAYQFCEACLDSFIESGGYEDYLYFMLDEDLFLEGSKLRQLRKKVKAFHDKQDEVSPEIAQRIVNDVQSRLLGNVKHPTIPPVGPVNLNPHKSTTKQTSNTASATNTNPNSTPIYKPNKNSSSSNPTNPPNDNTNNDNIIVSQSQQQTNKKGRFGKYGKYGLAAGALAALGGGLAYANRDKIKGLFNKGGNNNQASAVKDRMQDILKQAQGKPKSWISKKIAALRGMYSQWLQRANRERDVGRASMFKKVASTIMNCIDALMQKLQNFAG